MPRPCVEVAVVLEREASPNVWEDWRFRIVEVVEQQEAFGREPRLLHDDGRGLLPEPQLRPAGVVRDVAHR
jgi:hypothetical protein